MPSSSLGQISGSYTSDGNAREIALPFRPTKFELFNETNFNSTATPGVVKRAWWVRSIGSDSAFTVKNTDGAATDESNFISSGGFTFVDPSILGPTLVDTAISGITQANPAVVTMSANHGLATNNLVRIINSTGMFQVTGFVWQVSVTGATTFTIPVNSSGFGAAATAGTVRRVFASEYQPDLVYITNISQAAQAVVSTSFDHGYSVDEAVTISVPTGWGMTEINGLRGEIVAVTANTFTVNINTSGFTAFSFPTSAFVSAGAGLPHAVPIGIERSNLLTDAVENQSNFTMRLGASVVGVSSDVVYWVASSSEENNPII
jgi:hypothetical protein